MVGIWAAVEPDPLWMRRDAADESILVDLDGLSERRNNSRRSSEGWHTWPHKWCGLAGR